MKRDTPLVKSLRQQILGLENDLRTSQRFSREVDSQRVQVTASLQMSQKQIIQLENEIASWKRFTSEIVERFVRATKSSIREYPSNLFAATETTHGSEKPVRG